MKQIIASFFCLCTGLIAADPAIAIKLGDLVRLNRDETVYFHTSPIPSQPKTGTTFPLAKTQGERAYLIHTRPGAATIAVNVTVGAVERAFSDRFSAAEFQVLTAGTPSYFLNGEAIVGPMHSGQMLPLAAEVQEPSMAKLREMLELKTELRANMKHLQTEKAREIEDTAGRLRGYFGESLVRGFLGAPETDAQQQQSVAGLLKGPMEYQRRRNAIAIMLRSLAHESIAATEAVTNTRQPAAAPAKLPVSITGSIEDGMIFVKVTNQSPFNLRQVVLTGHAPQDPKLLAKAQNQNNLLGALGTLFMPTPDTARNFNDLAQAEAQLASTAEESFIALPELPAGGWVKFAIGELRMSTSATVSLWSNEGAATAIPVTNLPAAIAAVRKAAEPKPGVRQPGTGFGRVLGPVRKNRSSTGGLDTSTGLDTATGLGRTHK